MMVYERKRERPIEGNPKVFMDVSVGEYFIGTMVFELFKDVAPTYADNFFALCTGEGRKGKITGFPLSYKNSYFLDLEQPRSYVKGGDLCSERGTWGESIYGKDFPYDVPKCRRGCTDRGLLCMNIADQYTLGSHFVITLEPDPSLDGLHVVFGKLVKGFATLEEIAADEYRSPFKVSDCGKYEGYVIEEDLTNARLTTEKIPKLPFYLDVQMCGRMVFKLFYDKAPLASENFRALCTGEKGCSPKTGKVLSYLRSFFYMKRGSSHVKGGTLNYRTDKGVESIYGPNSRHVVETNDLVHDKEGLLSISKTDLEASCGSFIITLRADPDLDRCTYSFRCDWRLLVKTKSREVTKCKGP